jgi:hypothetical protein
MFPYFQIARIITCSSTGLIRVCVAAEMEMKESGLYPVLENNNLYKSVEIRFEEMD